MAKWNDPQSDPISDISALVEETKSHTGLELGKPFDKMSNEEKTSYVQSLFIGYAHHLYLSGKSQEQVQAELDALKVCMFGE